MSKYTYSTRALFSLLVLGLGCSDGWREATNVLEKLDCGMSKEAVISILPTSHSARSTSHSDGELYEISIESGPRLRLFFSPDGLYAVRVTEVVGLMKVFEHPLENLCTGERSIRVTVMAENARWGGSSVILDGLAVGRLPVSAVPTIDLELPLGRHQVHLQGGDGLSAAAPLELTDESGHVTVVFGESAAPVVTKDPPESPPRRWRGEG